MPVVASEVMFRYGMGPWILDNACFRIERGESVAVMGPSGSGKTTLIQIVGGLLSPRSGWVRCSEDEPPEPTLRTSWIFQASNAFGRRSVRDNVRLGLFDRRIRGHTGLERVDELVDRVGLSRMADRKAGSLSGGELQRIGIARALVGGASLVLADEPTGQLDHATTMTIAETLVEARTPGSILLVATHDSEVADMCDRRFVIQDGNLSEVR